MTRRLDGKAIVVTGAGRGIGAAIARLAAREGARVVVNDVDGPAAEHTVIEIQAAGGDARADASDIGDPEGAQTLINRCLDAFGAVDGLVNNAAVYRLGTLAEASLADFDLLWRVNVQGTFLCAQAALPHMLAQGRGSIVNVTSGAQTGMHSMTAYGATKAAVAAMTYTWAIETKDAGVRVNAISPLAATRMAQIGDDYHRDKQIARRPRNLPPPEANAVAAAFLLSDLASGVTGQVVRVEGGRISLMSHPAIRLPVFERESWSVDELGDLFARELSAASCPVGLAAAEVRYASAEDHLVRWTS